MNFNQHSNLKGQHALLSASKFHWLRYDEEKLINYYKKCQAAQMGTTLHAFACQCIELGQKLPRSKRTLNMFVNDAIGYKMIPEQVLYFSENCFGTADAICFRNNFLRIHDYKSGEIPAHMEQLMIYAAIFCLEYKVDPNKIEMELRLYQSDDIIFSNPEPEEISAIMDTIVRDDQLIDQLKVKEG